MCSELDNESASSITPTVSDEKPAASQEVQETDAQSESEDDDIGSEELMCKENIDVNDKDSDDSDEEELTNRVFPQQKFSPVPFTARRSQTPDFSKIRYSPISFPTKRAVTPNIYEQMVGKGHSHELPDSSFSKPASSVTEFGFREPKGIPHANRFMGKNETGSSQAGQFVRPRLPTPKSHSPGLTVSGCFQPKGSVFKPRQPSGGSALSKVPPVSSETAPARSTDSLLSQPAIIPSHVTKFSSEKKASQGFTLPGKSPNSPRLSQYQGEVAQLNTRYQTNVKASNEGSASNVHSVPSFSLVTTAATSISSSVTPLTISVATHTTPPFQQTLKSTAVLSPRDTKGVSLKPIAPLLSPPLRGTSQSGVNHVERLLLSKKPTSLSGTVPGQGFSSHSGVGYFNSNPIALNANQGNASSLAQTPTNPQRGPSPIPTHAHPRQLPLSPKPVGPTTTLLSPKRNASYTGTVSLDSQERKAQETVVALQREQTVASPVSPAQGAQRVTSNVNVDSKVNSKSILKRFIADGMEE